MRTPIRITKAGRLGRAEFQAFGSTVTVLVTSPGSTARAALTVRRGLTLLDVSGGAGRARAADRLVADAARASGCGVLLSIGGDIATAGPAPNRGWKIRIAPGGSGEAEVMYLTTGGLATVRSAGKDSARPNSVWKSVTVAGGSCRQARSVALAAAARGKTGADWVTSLRLSALLAGTDGSLIHTGGWMPESAAA